MPDPRAARPSSQESNISTNPIKTVCVFCGANPGKTPAYGDVARRFGEMLAREGIGLVYGGGSVGLMGVVANAARAGGSAVTGVIPYALLRRELGQAELGDLRIVNSMHERKALMASLADAFVALPGGIGTLEEIFEVVSWAQLGQHTKPCGFLNVDGYYDGLLSFIDHAVAEGFIKAQDKSLLVIERDPSAMLSAIRAYRAPTVQKWIGREES